MSEYRASYEADVSKYIPGKSLSLRLWLMADKHPELFLETYGEDPIAFISGFERLTTPAPWDEEQHQINSKDAWNEFKCVCTFEGVNIRNKQALVDHISTRLLWAELQVHEMFFWMNQLSHIPKSIFQSPEMLRSRFGNDCLQ